MTDERDDKVKNAQTTEADLASDRMGRNSLQGDDQESVEKGGAQYPRHQAPAPHPHGS